MSYLKSFNELNGIEVVIDRIQIVFFKLASGRIINFIMIRPDPDLKRDYPTGSVYGIPFEMLRPAKD